MARVAYGDRNNCNSFVVIDKKKWRITFAASDGASWHSTVWHMWTRNEKENSHTRSLSSFNFITPNIECTCPRKRGSGAMSKYWVYFRPSHDMTHFRRPQTATEEGLSLPLDCALGSNKSFGLVPSRRSAKRSKTLKSHYLFFVPFGSRQSASRRAKPRDDCPLTIVLPPARSILQPLRAEQIKRKHFFGGEICARDTNEQIIFECACDCWFEVLSSKLHIFNFASLPHSISGSRLSGALCVQNVSKAHSSTRRARSQALINAIMK